MISVSLNRKVTLDVKQWQENKM